ncbi:MAG TPA: hypothetical protein VE955_00175 [Candidatus Dormibacteraeota bacterium]|jgi:hypothetical protein|nr:hypothetical protein [Candidatus Dormibacteraeota bacterium]
MLDHYSYLLRAIRENQKKTIPEWNALIRTALLEIDEALGKDGLVIEDRSPSTFEDYRKHMERLAASLQLSQGRVSSVAWPTSKANTSR